jgi:hypothetical protein
MTAVTYPRRHQAAHLLTRVAAHDSGHRGSLTLRCKALSSSASCRFIPAHRALDDQSSCPRSYPTTFCTFPRELSSRRRTLPIVFEELSGLRERA